DTVLLKRRGAAHRYGESARGRYRPQFRDLLGRVVAVLQAVLDDADRWALRAPVKIGPFLPHLGRVVVGIDEPGDRHRLVAHLGDLLVGDGLAVVAFDHQRQWFGAEPGEDLVELLLRLAHRVVR